MFSLDVDFDKAIEECCQPEEPLEKGGEHDGAHDSHIDDLRIC